MEEIAPVEKSANMINLISYAHSDLVHSDDKHIVQVLREDYDIRIDRFRKLSIFGLERRID